ncbi:hypothetical protein ACWGID_11155 [Kribbella sp. NPDC054772]
MRWLVCRWCRLLSVDDWFRFLLTDVLETGQRVVVVHVGAELGRVRRERIFLLYTGVSRSISR